MFAFEARDAERFIGAWPENVGAWTCGEREEHLRDEHSTYAWLLEPMLERAGFEIQDVEYDARRIFARYICVRAP